ncbi:MAG: M15 family metallopeptidase [Actinobacteria bacterium]|nr:M15 family metallopeptidase [Actinomycetota bacterium]
MTGKRSSYHSPPRRRIALIALALAAGATLLGLLGHQVFAILSAALPASADAGSAKGSTPRSGDLPNGRAPTAKDGVLPDGTTVFDTRLPGVDRLHPELSAALRAAAEQASVESIEIRVTSGWRSKKYQRQLQRDAIAEYGSETEAARWVSSPDRSAHVTGNAVDLAPYEATYWLEQNGAAFGLCRIYANENWHFELRPEAAQQGCPEMYADPTENPALQP